MSKTKVIEIVEQNGVSYGQISHPRDLVLSQQYSHEHIEQITKDFLIQDVGEIAGGNLVLTSGLSVNVAAGRIYQSGLQYEFQAEILTMEPPHEEFPRVDLVVAVLQPNSPANTEFLAFQRLRTEQELNDGLSSYPPTQFQRFTERHNIASLIVKTGIPSAAPLPPVLNADEVALYEINVAANATTLVLLDVYDARRIATNLRTVNQQIVSMLASIRELERKILVQKYRFPTLVSADGRCPANVNQDANDDYVIDIPIGTLVQFGDRFVYVEAATTQPVLNPRRSNASNPAEVTYQELFAGENIEPTHPRPASTDNLSTNANVVRIDAPTTRKWLYLSYNGDLFFRSEAQHSHSNQCLLLRIDPVIDGEPTLKSYRNLRNGSTRYSNTYVANDISTRQFENNIAMPPGYLYAQAFAVRASDKTMYHIPVPVIEFDAISTVEGVAPGDKWVVELTVLSNL